MISRIFHAPERVLFTTSTINQLTTTKFTHCMQVTRFLLFKMQY